MAELKAQAVAKTAPSSKPLARGDPAPAGFHESAGEACACGGAKSHGFDFTGVPVFARSQRASSSSTPADPAEREADDVADRILDMAAPVPIGASTPGIQRKCATCAQDESRKRVQTQHVPSAMPTSHLDTGAAERAAARGGVAMAPELRSYFEPRFGHDFGNVRIHADGDAARAARAVQARAYTFGNDIVFGAGEFTPQSAHGRRLIAHELTHVIQQRRGAANVASRVLARQPLDVNAIDQSIDIAARAKPACGFIGRFLSRLPQLIGHKQGEIAFAANYPGGKAPPSAPAKPPKADKAPVPIDASVPVEAHFFPSGRLQSKERALILGGFHGDERPGWEVCEALIAQLAAPAKGAKPLFFHTIVVPRVNAGAIANELAGTKFWRNRCNRQAVDLNRNFPTGGTPKDTDCVNTEGAPVQPEVKGVIDLIKAFKPDRILSTHAISTPAEAGVFADPNTDPAAIALAGGMASMIADPRDRPFNRRGGAFNPVYPRDSPGKVSGGTSLGQFGPTATGGKIPVITMEAPEFRSLAPTGTRSVEGFLKPVNAFLDDPAQLDASADQDILDEIAAFTAADQLAFLTGRLSLKNRIYDRIALRIEIAIGKLNQLKPPVPVRIVSGMRMYSEDVPGPTGGSAQAKIVFNKFFFVGSPDTESFPDKFFNGGDRKKGLDVAKWRNAPSLKRLKAILKFSSLPGTSRHHWATDVDFNSTSSADWQPAPTAGGKAGRLFDLGVWLGANAAKAGFIQAYSPGRGGGYGDEAWHFSYAPIAKGLRQLYDKNVKLTSDVADVFVDDMKKRAKAAGLAEPADLDAAVKSLNLKDYVDKVDPKL